ncbi:MAG: hypothetical protein WD360_01705 [Nitriliruptoraceae bacterium]
MMRRRRSQRFVLLGQYLDPNAAIVAEALETAGIPFYITRAGALTQSLFMGEWGVRIFVGRDTHTAAQALADSVVEA